MADLDSLYQLPLGEFITGRNALAKALKATDKARAAEVKALGRPSLSAWVVNQLYWLERDAFDALLRAGARLRAAQTSALTGRPATDLREATAERRAAVESLLTAAERLLVESETAATAATFKRVGASLEAIAIWGGDVPGPGAGYLVNDVEPPGFEALAALATQLPPVAPSAPAPVSAPARPSPAPIEAQPADASDEGRRAEARARRLAELAATLRRAETELVGATARVKAARNGVSAGQAAVEAARAALVRAEEEVAEAGAEVAEAEVEVAEAEAEVARLQNERAVLEG